MTEKKVCFVIAPRGEQDSDASRQSGLVLRHIIEPAATRCGYTVVTALATNLITSEIIKNILSAPIVIADLSGGNPNVFYNLAVRHVARKPVIQLIAKDQPLPFDVRDSRTIRYEINDLNSQKQASKEIVEQVRMIERNVSPMESPISVAGTTTWTPFAVAQKSLQHLQLDFKTKTKLDELLEKFLAAETLAPEVKSLIEALKAPPRVFLLKNSTDDLEAVCTVIQNVPEGGLISATSSLQGQDSDERQIYRTLLNRRLENGVMYHKIICSVPAVTSSRYEVWASEIEDKAGLIEIGKIRPDAFQFLHYPWPVSVDVLISQNSEGECLEMVAGFSGKGEHGGFRTEDPRMVEEWLDVYLESKIIPLARAHTESVLKKTEECFCFEFLTRLESARQETLTAGSS